MEKRATVVDSIRNSEQNVLLLDGGDILNFTLNFVRHKFVVQAFNRLEYDAWIFGEQDFSEGDDFFLNNLVQIKAGLVNTNLKYKNKLQGSRYLIRQFDNLTIGITGTISEALKHYITGDAANDIKIENQIKELQPVIDEMTMKCDYIILLSHSGLEQDKKIAAFFPEINLIIGAHSQSFIQEPVRIEETLIVQAGENGYRVGELKLSFESKKLMSARNNLILLDKKIKNHPEIMNLINEYQKQLKPGRR